MWMGVLGHAPWVLAVLCRGFFYIVLGSLCTEVLPGSLSQVQLLEQNWIFKDRHNFIKQ